MRACAPASPCCCERLNAAEALVEGVPVGEPVLLREAEALVEGVPVSAAELELVGMPDMDPVLEGEGVPVPVAEDEAEPVPVELAVDGAVALTLCEPEAVWEAESEPELVREGAGESVCEELAVPLCAELAVPVCEPVLLRLPVALVAGVPVCEPVLLRVAVAVTGMLGVLLAAGELVIAAGVGAGEAGAARQGSATPLEVKAAGTAVWPSLLRPQQEMAPAADRAQVWK